MSITLLVLTILATIKIHSKMPPNERVVELANFEDEINRLNVHSLLDATIQNIFDQIEEAETIKSKSHDESIYTGKMGLVWAYMIAFESTIEDEPKHLYLKKAQTLIQSAKANVKTIKASKSASLFTSSVIGIHTMAAIVYHSLNDPKSRDFHISELLKLEPKGGDGTSSELLYGKAGYIFALDLIASHVSPEIIAGYEEILCRQTKLIIEEGLDGYIGDWPLMWQWHGTSYLGAAHGVSGILSVLLRHPGCLEKVSFDLNGRKVSAKELVRETVVKTLSKGTVSNAGGPLGGIEAECARLPSGNWKSSLESSTRDKLVQWCHGAPGVISMMVEAIKVFPDLSSILKESINDAVTIIHDRGVLCKGLGLCHGISGNGYALLKASLSTGKAEYLEEALRFARIIILWTRNDSFRSLFQRPDHPFSLFEGIAGALAFLSHIKAVLDSNDRLTTKLFPV